MSFGKFLATPSKIATRNWKMLSTICGVYLTIASRTPTKSFRAPSAIIGTHSTRTFTTSTIITLTASQIAGTLRINTSQNATTASVSTSMISGMIFNIPIIIIRSVATIDAATATVIPANAVNPAAAAKQPTPIKAAAAPIANNPGISPPLVTAFAATIKIPNATPNVISPLAMPSQLSFSKLCIPDANIFIDADMTNNAAAIPRRLFPVLDDPPTIFENAAIISNIPPIAVPAFAKLPQSISAKSCAADANTFMDAAITIRPAPVLTI